MNLAAIRTGIQALGYGTDTATQQNYFVNKTYREVCGMARWPFLEKQDISIVTVNGTAGYAINSLIPDYRNIDAVRLEIVANQEYYDLEYQDPQEFRDQEHLDRDVSTPFYWTVINNTLRFYPTPERAYTVRVDYISEPTDLAADGDVPVLPIQYHDILVFGGASLAAYRQRDWLGRQFLQQEMEVQVKRMQQEYFLRQRQTSSHVKSSGYWNTKRPFPFAHAGW